MVKRAKILLGCPMDAKGTDRSGPSFAGSTIEDVPRGCGPIRFTALVPLSANEKAPTEADAPSGLHHR